MVCIYSEQQLPYFYHKRIRPALWSLSLPSGVTVVVVIVIAIIMGVIVIAIIMGVIVVLTAATIYCKSLAYCMPVIYMQ